MHKLLLAAAVGLALFQPALAQDSGKKNAGSSDVPAALAEALPVLDNTIKAPAIADLNISPDYPAALLKVDSKTYQNELEYSPAADKARYYFDADSNAVDAPAAGGYYRDILGTTADGKIVAQDFYQDSETAQTAPFILNEGKERDFSTDSNDGRVIWYDTQGKVTSIDSFNKGQQEGWGLIVSEKGALRIKDPHIALYRADGSLLMYNDNDNHHQQTFYYPDGRPMISFIEKEGRKSYLAWTQSGEPVSADKIRDDFVPAYELMMDIMDNVRLD